MKKTLCCVIVLTGACFSQAAERRLSREEGDTKAAFLFAGVKDRIDRTRQGVVHAVGRKSLNNPRRGAHQGSVEFFLAFDHDVDYIRFDNHEWLLTRQAAGVQASQAASQTTTAPHRTKYYRTSKESGHYFEANKQLSIYEFDKKPVLYSRPLDIRCAGLFFIGDLSEPKDFTAIRENYFPNVPDEVVEEMPNKYRLRWNYAKGASTTLWLDQAGGFAPTRYELRESEDPSSPPTYLSQATWTKMGAVWVPTSLVLASHHDLRKQGAPGPSLEKYEFSLQWESVNLPIRPGLFESTGLDLPKGTLVFDRRLDPPLLLRAEGVDRSTLIAPPLEEESDLPRRKWSLWRTTFVSLNILFLIAILVVVLRQRRRASVGSGNV